MGTVNDFNMVSSQSNSNMFPVPGHDWIVLWDAGCPSCTWRCSTVAGSKNWHWHSCSNGSGTRSTIFVSKLDWPLRFGGFDQLENGWIIMENPILKWKFYEDLGHPYFRKPPFLVWFNQGLAMTNKFGSIFHSCGGTRVLHKKGPQCPGVFTNSSSQTLSYHFSEFSKLYTY